MALCNRCGIDLPVGANYCPNCGRYTGRSMTEEFEVTSDQLVRQFKELLNEANVTKIIVEDDKGKTLLEIPVTAGLRGALLAPWLAALGAAAAIATECTIRVEKNVDKTL
jgi:hypothetical protein